MQLVSTILKTESVLVMTIGNDSPEFLRNSNLIAQTFKIFAKLGKRRVTLTEVAILQVSRRLLFMLNPTSVVYNDR